MRISILFVAAAVASCAPNSEPLAAGPPAEENVEATVFLPSQIEGGGLIRLDIGQPFYVAKDDFEISIVHDLWSMVTRFDGNIVDYEETSFNGLKARTASYDYGQTDGRRYNLARRIVIFLDPIQFTPDVDRVQIQIFCNTRSECGLADTVAASIKFNPVP